MSGPTGTARTTVKTVKTSTRRMSGAAFRLLLLDLASGVGRSGKNAAIGTGSGTVRTAEELSHMVADLKRSMKSCALPVSGLQHRARIASLNLGLLNALTYQVPYYRQRRQHAAQAIAAWLQRPDAPDVVFLQELWHKADIKAVHAAAAAAGFIFLLRKERGNSHGLEILIRRAFVADPADVAYDHKYFQSYARLEHFIGYQRTALLASVKTASGGELLLVNTHLTSARTAADVRCRQVWELAGWVRSRCGPRQFVAVGGDFNASPTFDLPVTRESAAAQLSQNINVYLEFYKATRSLNLVDSWWALHDDVGATWDGRRNSTIQALAGDEPLQRLDYVWFGGPAPFQVLESKLEFDQPLAGVHGKPVTVDGIPLYLSDHFGVSSQFAW